MPHDRTPGVDLRQSYELIRKLWWIQWGVVLALWLLVPLELPPGRARPMPGLALIFYAVGVVDIAVVWGMRLRAAAAPGPREEPAARLRRLLGPTITGVAVSVTPAVLGLVLYLVFGDRAAQSVLSALSVVALGVARPRANDWVT
ncbi:MAG: hypothetical protein QN183_12305 [Armatimonadota bacterium]|nr:hypothetical protein [Armatimonadota bacterium]MDR7485257.1 hypothetical protein [Armatimonadota bacterium]MDR7533905.1 hypothetical protein [Armatimonadota bacterium]MDR7537133.1 hypothetical protein [Armatimonadota bacterium]